MNNMLGKVTCTLGNIDLNVGKVATQICITLIILPPLYEFY